MLPRLFDMLICPICKSSRLKLQQARLHEDEIWSGKILCEGCRQTYPVTGGIPCMLPTVLLKMQSDADTEEWIQKKKKIEENIVDENLEKFKFVYKEAARENGLSEETDRFIWEKIMHRDNQSLRKSLGTEKASKWVITRDNISKRNERIFSSIRKFEGSEDSFAGSLALNVGPGIDDDLIDRLNSSGAEVINCDIIPDTLIELKSQDKGEGISSDLKCLPFAEGMFDMVFCFLVLHHIDPVEQALSEVMRVLKPGGKVFILEMNPYTLVKLPGKVLPVSFKRTIRKAMRKYLAGSEQRIFKSTPYEKIYPGKFIISLMSSEGFYNITKKVVSHYPPFVPRAVAIFWDFLARFAPSLFDKIALEYIFYGKKSGDSRESHRK